MQWFKGKSLDGFCPMGPVVVTADEFGDPQTKRLQLPGQRRHQAGRETADMIFPVDDHRVAVEGADARSRRRHRDRHAGGRRHGPHAAGVPAGR